MVFRIGEENVINLKDYDKLNKEDLNKLLEDVKENNKYGDIIWCDDLPKDQESKNLIEEIEKQLEHNNKNFSRFPSDYLHALFSYIVYSDLKDNDKLDTLELDLDENRKIFSNLVGWEVLEVFAKPAKDEGLIKKGSVYFGALLFNKYLNQMVLAHRGISADWLSWFKKESSVMTNLSGIMLNETVPQMLCCYEVVEHVLKKYAQTEKYKDFYLSFTGYSNGAWLAQYSVYYSHYHFNYKKSKAVLFESPGFSKNEEHFNSNIISPESDINLGDMNVISYLTAPNLANSCNRHVGIVYRVFVEKEKNSEDFQNFINDFIDAFKILDRTLKQKMKNIKFLTDGLFNMFNHKNLKKIIELFDEKTGKPKYYEQMLDWPIAGFNFDKDYDENLKNLIDSTANKIVDNVPFANILPEFFLDITKEGLKFISKAVDKASQFIAPGLFIFLNILIEICKGNMDLNQLENDLFDKKLEELNEITTNEDYIDYRYNRAQDEKAKKSFFEKIKKIKPNFMKPKIVNETIKKESDKMSSREKKIQNKIQLLASYKPRHVSSYFKALNPKLDTENIDYCLIHIKILLNDDNQNLSDENKLSDLFKKLLIEFKNLYEIKLVLDESLESVNFIYSKNESVTIDTIKERLERLLLINGLLLKKLINPTYIVQQLKTERNIQSFSLTSNYLIGDLENKYVPVISFESIYSKFIEDNKKKILIYGPNGFGKTTFASQFGRYFCQQNPSENNICLSFEMGSRTNIIENYFDRMIERLKIREGTDLTRIQLNINDKLNNMLCKKILFIFDDVKFNLEIKEDESFRLIEEIIKNLPLKVYVLFTSTVDDGSFHQKFDYTEKVKGFSKDQAYDLFKKCLSYKKGKIESIMTKLDTIKQTEQIKTDSFIPLKVVNIIRYIESNQNKTIGQAIEKIKLEDINVYEDLFNELINNQENVQVSIFEIIAFLHSKKITFNFLQKIEDDEDLIDLALKKLRSNSIIFESDYDDNEDDIFFNIEDTLQIELLNYLEKKRLKLEKAEHLLVKIFCYYKALDKKKFASIKLYELNHCLTIIKHGDQTSKNFVDCFLFFKDNIRNLARSFKNAEKYEEAIKYYNKLVDMEIIRKDKDEIYSIYLNLKNCCNKIGNMSEENYYKKELERMNESGFIFVDKNFDSIEERENPYKEIISNIDEIKEQQEKAVHFYNLGLNAKKMGYFYDAFILIEKSYNIHSNANASVDSVDVKKFKINLKKCLKAFENSEKTSSYTKKLEELQNKSKRLEIDL